MLTKRQLQHFKSLKDPAERKISRSFLVEGPKLVEELLNSTYKVLGIYGLADWIENYSARLEKDGVHYESVSPAELEKISSLTTPNMVVAHVAMPSVVLDWKLLTKDLSLMLDSIRDPGNLGTIIRIADWFGISQIICSPGSVDVYNPKVVQSTMGSLFRVNVFYEDLSDFLSDLPGDIPVFGAVLDGTPLTECKLPSNGILLIGSESHGISEEVLVKVTDRLKIPSFLHSDHKQGAESLNASIAAAILCYEFRFKSEKESPHC